MLPIPRILYGLHEKFVLFPFERGSRFARLVIRCVDLHRFCQGGGAGRRTLAIGHPFVLGELREGKMSKATFVPKVMGGAELSLLGTRGSNEWLIRHYRIAVLANRSMRFEAGTKRVYATHTPFFSFELLEKLTREGLEKEGTRERVPESG